MALVFCVSHHQWSPIAGHSQGHPVYGGQRDACESGDGGTRDPSESPWPTSTQRVFSEDLIGVCMENEKKQVFIMCQPESVSSLNNYAH